MTQTFIVDSREQKPYEFDSLENVVERKLPVGDYTIDGFEHTFAVERKTLDDLAKSLGTDRNRFENEIRRANGYAHRNEDDNPLPGTKPDYELREFAVVIEAPPEHVYKYRGKKKSPHYYSKLYPNTIIGTTEQWPEKYDKLEFYWCQDREGGKQKTLELLDSWFIEYGTSL